MNQLEIEKRSRREQSKRGNEMRDLSIVRKRIRRSSLELARVAVLGVALETFRGLVPVRRLGLQLNRSEYDIKQLK